MYNVLDLAEAALLEYNTKPNVVRFQYSQQLTTH